MEDLTRNFDILLDKAYRLFEFSEVKFRQYRNTLKWGLSLCATPINPGKAVILGISWGGAVSPGVSNYSIQRRFPVKEEFLEDYNAGDIHLLQSRKSSYLSFFKSK